MAAPDPRRSSRARTSQPQSRPSSTTSSVSGRDTRSFRPSEKTGSPQKSASVSASLASEPPDDAAATTDGTPPPPPRSRRSTHHTASAAIKDDDQDLSSVVVSEIEMLHDGDGDGNGDGDGDGDDDIQEDDEAVRCICGQDDYPGPPSEDDQKQAARDGFDVEATFPTVVTEDLAGFFVQCDICKVWQHGACVGLVNDSTLPEEYYCEECRKNLHKIFPGTNGRSRRDSFLKDHERSPKVRDSSKDSIKDAGKESKDKDSRDGKEGKDGKDGKDKDGKDTRSSRPASVGQASKRRSTMNSRDAAYDEEQLRIAIEASKEDAPPESIDGGSVRRAKRGRSGSEEKFENIKRPRTASQSPSPGPFRSAIMDDSDDAMATRNGSSSKKASRSATATRSQQQRERAEREEKERQRAEAANKRNGRAERRRADGTDAVRDETPAKPYETHSDIDSDPSDEVPLAVSRAAGAPVAATTTGAGGVSATSAADSARTSATGVTAAAAAAAATASSASATTSGAAAATAGAGKAAGEGTEAGAGSAGASSPSGTATAPAATPSGASTRSAPSRPAQPTPETPPPTSAPAMSASKSKGGRPTHKKKGRNQYTKDRDAREEQSSNRSQSRDVQDHSHGHGHGHGNSNSRHHGKSGAGGSGNQNSKSGSRAKGGMNSRITMSEMKRRVAAMFDFISKTQIELAGEDDAEAMATTTTTSAKQSSHGGSTKQSANHGSSHTAATTTPTTPNVPIIAVNGNKAGANGNGGSAEGADADGGGGIGGGQREFKSLSCLEMMDSLTRDIVHWQSQFAS